MGTAFSTALSALNADSTAIDVVGNNLANLNTTGFKASTVEFSDLMAEQLGTASGESQVGLGVGQVAAVQNFSQGSITNTGAALDAAIQGNGFFVVTDSNNNQLYTRDGSFQLNSDGVLQTVTGQDVQGWMATNGVVNANGPTTNISVPVGSSIQPQATANMSMGINLNSATAVNGTFSAPIQVYDSLGQAHTLTVTFTETAPENWNYAITIPSTDLAAGANNQVANGTLTFGSNGQLTNPAAVAPPGPQVPINFAVPGLADGADDLNINWNVFDSNGNSLITQYAQASAESNPTQDGFAAGQISQVSIQNGGLVVASYTNGQQVTVGQLAVASIANPTSLADVGDNNLQATAATAQAAIGASGAGGNGTIQGESLEASTTDMAAEFTNLLSYERSYQAASRVITTADTLAQETVNLIH
ncbi:MAG TPA: flagellar hook protein FlgE [Bryobacteraceae bacterium]|nr:flagellar hook protein FlgE [Bryobacteraceae bacterium]